MEKDEGGDDAMERTKRRWWIISSDVRRAEGKNKVIMRMEG